MVRVAGTIVCLFLVTAAAPDRPSVPKQTALQRAQSKFPTIPEPLLGIYAQSDGNVDINSPCTLVEWLASSEAHLSGRERERIVDQLAVCGLPIDDVTISTASEMLGDRSLAGELKNGVLTIVARSSSDKLSLCCSLSMDLQRIGTSEYWAARVRLAQSERAMLSLSTQSGTVHNEENLTIRGPLAPPAPKLSGGNIRGQLIYNREFYSAALGETRKLNIYLPPGWSKEKKWPVIYLTDGAAAMFPLLVEKMIDDCAIRPIVLVSALSGADGIVGQIPTGRDLRADEYLKDFPGSGDRFARHMNFFAKELTHYAQTEFNVSTKAQDTAVAGFSNGGVFALWAGLMQPETFGHVIAMSPGYISIKPADLSLKPRTDFQISAGIYEAGFISTTQKAGENLISAGYKVIGRYSSAGHSQDQWEYVFHEAVKQIYGHR